MKDYRKIAEYHRLMETDKWSKEIPKIAFKSDWEVKITPGFAGAVVRFRVYKGDAEVSVYLDCYDQLGCYGEPYWEVYPHENDVYRCDMANVDELLKAIEQSITEQLNQ